MAVAAVLSAEAVGRDAAAMPDPGHAIYTGRYNVPSDWISVPEPMSLPHRLHNSEALILKYRNFREADRILTLLTPDLGKLDALARGVRKARSRKSGHVEPFMQITLVLHRTRWLPEVSEAQIRQAFPHCRATLENMGHASYACELADAFIHPEEDATLSQSLYRVLLTVLQDLDARPEKAPVLLRWFDLRVLGLTGFQPELFHCLACGQTAPPASCFFSSGLGGILCPACGPAAESVLSLDLDAFKILRHLQRYDWHKVSDDRYRPESLRAVTRILQHYVAYTLEHQLRSVRFARQVRRLAQQ